MTAILRQFIFCFQMSRIERMVVPPSCYTYIDHVTHSRHYHSTGYIIITSLQHYLGCCNRQYWRVSSSRTTIPNFASSFLRSLMSAVFLSCNAFSRAFISALADGEISGVSGTQRRYASLKGSPSDDQG